MNCFPEWIYSVYVDGELAEAERRPVEAHLVSCQSCRELIVALREEAGVLGDSLHEREPAVLRPRSAAPVRGLALGGVPTLALIAVVAGVVGSVLETQLSSYAEWLNPLRLLGAYDMAFDLVFWLRDEVPGLLEFAIAAAALLCVAALLTLLVSALSRRWLGTASMLAGIALLLALASPARAIVVLHDLEDFQVAAGEVQGDSVVVSAESVRIDGVVDGDLFVFAERLIVRGEIRGNLFAGARNVELPGRVHGSVYGVARRLHVAGQVDRNILTGSDQYILDDAGRIGGDAVHFGENVTIQGSIARDLYGIGELLELDGRVGRNVDAIAERVSLLGNADVGGDLLARLPRGEEAQIAATARIAGESRSEAIAHDHQRRFMTGGFWIAMLLHIAAAFALAAVLRLLLPNLLTSTMETSGDFFRALGLGFVALVVTPIALIAVAVTLAGIPLAVIGCGVYVTALYVSTIVVAAMIGRSIERGSQDAGPSGISLTSLLVGVVVVVAAAHVPFLGPLFGIVIVLTGLGLLVQHAQARWGFGRGLNA